MRIRARLRWSVPPRSLREESAQDDGVAIHVKASVDLPAGRQRQIATQRRLGEQPLEPVGQRDGITLWGEEAGPTVMHDLWDPGHVGGYTRGAERHGLDQDGGQAVAVTVGGYDAGRS